MQASSSLDSQSEKQTEFAMPARLSNLPRHQLYGAGELFNSVLELHGPERST
jgi:hypothetical protein